MSAFYNYVSWQVQYAAPSSSNIADGSCNSEEESPITECARQLFCDELQKIVSVAVRESLTLAFAHNVDPFGFQENAWRTMQFVAQLCVKEFDRRNLRKSLAHARLLIWEIQG